MNDDSTDRYASWHPMSFAGVAAFAVAPISRLLIVTALFLCLFGTTVVWLFVQAYLPVLEGAMASLPSEGAIRYGFLEWSGPSEAVLDGGAFLEIAVDLEAGRSFQSTADLSLLLARSSYRIGSLFGATELPYPVGYKIELSRVEVMAWWGAWKPVALLGGAVVASMALLVAWSAMALIYAPAIRMVAFVAGRQVTLLGCWKLCLAAFLPGTLLCVSAIVLYGLNRIPMLGLMGALAAYWIAHCVYLGLAVLRLPAVAAARRSGNPFALPGSTPDSSRNRKNPFS